jgi:hypothetical protein
MCFACEAVVGGRGGGGRGCVSEFHRQQNKRAFFSSFLLNKFILGKA